MEKKPIVLTLDAGGTNFVFSAIQENEKIIDEIHIPTDPNNLDVCLKNIVDGFSEAKSKLKDNPSAISFAFPGPADYPKGIIADLPNLPAFRGGVALGPMLKDKFGIPVFINNDGDLFAYGEALLGFLPHVNKKLEESDSPKRFKNLIGITFGTGFGCGIVINKVLLNGDNSCGGEIWLLRNKLMPSSNVEEHGSIRGVKSAFSKYSKIPIQEVPSPKDIYEIAKGEQEGNKAAAIKAFSDMAEVAGEAISTAVTLIDGLVVIGGGLSGAADLFLPKIVNEMNGTFTKSDGTIFNRLSFKTYNLEDDTQFAKFVTGSAKKIKIYGSEKTIDYDAEKRVGIGISKLGTSHAISLGAYVFAVNQLNK